MFIIFECIDLSISPFSGWTLFMVGAVLCTRMCTCYCVWRFLFSLCSIGIFNIFLFINFYNISHMHDKRLGSYLLNIKIRTNENSRRLKQLNKLTMHCVIYIHETTDPDQKTKKKLSNQFRSCLSPCLLFHSFSRISCSCIIFAVQNVHFAVMKREYLIENN